MHIIKHKWLTEIIIWNENKEREKQLKTNFNNIYGGIIHSKYRLNLKSDDIKKTFSEQKENWWRGNWVLYGLSEK